MAKSNSKVVDFGAYLKAHQNLTQIEIDAAISERRTCLRSLDAKVIELLSDEHKLKATQKCKDISVQIESHLFQLSDWLEDRISETDSEDVKAKYQASLKQCEQLISRNERIKKNISDDMAACRYVEGQQKLDPVKVVGFLIATPVALATLTKTFLTDKPDAIAFAGKVGVATGIFWAFHYQAKDMVKSAGKCLKHCTQSFKRSLRHSAFNATMVVNEAIYEARGFELNKPGRNSIRPKIYISAGM